MSFWICNRSVQGLSMGTSPCLASLKQEKGGVLIMYAIIETGGKQIRVEEGATIFVEKLDLNEGDKVVFDQVIAVTNKTVKVGTPYVKGAKVNGVVEKQGKDKKIVIFKYKPKKGSTRRKQGHRQPYTKVLIQKIEG